MSQIESWSIEGSNGQPILGETHLPPNDPVGALLIAHGFKGYKDYGFVPYLATQAAAHGLVAHRFNFSHSGMTNRIETFERPDLFEQDTWERQIEDLRTVSEAAADGLPGPPNLPQAWFGHSRGGVTTILTAGRAEKENTRPQPAGIIVAASPDAACNLSDDEKTRLRRRGALESPSSRTGQVLRVGGAWLDEIEADPDAFDPVRQIQAITCPILILHGQEDPTVPASAANMLANAAGDNATLHIIPGAQHTFNCPNPHPADKQPPGPTQVFVQLVCEFAARTCGG